MIASDETPPIIIYGAPRSGTTYLNSILNQHPDVFITHETRLFVWAHRSLNVLPKDDKAVLSYRDDFVRHLHDSFPQIIRTFYHAINTTRARYWGDKNPHYADPGDSGCLKTIATLFPGTRFIHIIRDGRDVVTSLLRRKWVNFNTAHRMWPRFVDLGCDFGRQQPTSHYLELRYEDLIKDDLAVTRSIFTFLGIPIHPNVIDYCNAQREMRLPLSGATRDLSSGVSVSDWSNFFTAEDQCRSLELLGPHLIRYGYETDESLARHCRDAAERRALSLLDLVHEICLDLPVDVTVAVVSKGDDALVQLQGRRACHFPQTDQGEYAGYHPADSRDAILLLEQARARGVEYLVFPHSSLWWLTHYQDFASYLDSRYILTVRQKSHVIYKLSQCPPEEMPPNATQRVLSDVINEGAI